MDFDDDDDGLFETVDLVEEEDEPCRRDSTATGAQAALGSHLTPVQKGEDAADARLWKGCRGTARPYGMPP